MSIDYHYSFYPQLTLTHLKRCFDNLIHIVILISAKTPSENHLIFLVRQLSVLLVQRIILVVIDRIVWLIALLPLEENSH